MRNLICAPFLLFGIALGIVECKTFKSVPHFVLQKIIDDDSTSTEERIGCLKEKIRRLRRQLKQSAKTTGCKRVTEKLPHETEGKETTNDELKSINCKNATKTNAVWEAQDAKRKLLIKETENRGKAVEKAVEAMAAEDNDAEISEAGEALPSDCSTQTEIADLQSEINETKAEAAEEEAEGASGLNPSASAAATSKAHELEEAVKSAHMGGGAAAAEGDAAKKLIGESDRELKDAMRKADHAQSELADSEQKLHKITKQADDIEERAKTAAKQKTHAIEAKAKASPPTLEAVDSNIGEGTMIDQISREEEMFLRRKKILQNAKLLSDIDGKEKSADAAAAELSIKANELKRAAAGAAKEAKEAEESAETAQYEADEALALAHRAEHLSTEAVDGARHAQTLHCKSVPVGKASKADATVQAEAKDIERTAQRVKNRADAIERKGEGLVAQDDGLAKDLAPVAASQRSVPGVQAVPVVVPIRRVRTVKTNQQAPANKQECATGGSKDDRYAEDRQIEGE